LANSLLTELKRRNVFKVGFSYVILLWIILQVTTVAVPAFNMPQWVNTVVFFLGIIGFPFALFFAWAFEMNHDGIKKGVDSSDEDLSPAHSVNATGRKWLVISIALVAIASGYFMYERPFVSAPEPAIVANDKPSNEIAAATTDVETASPVLSLVVLPFVNMSSDPEQEYFVDGLTEELLNSLTRIKGLKLAARTTSFSYKNKNIDIRDIAQSLDVQYLVEGSVRKRGEDIRITMQLINGADGAHILSKTFDRKLVNVFALQEEISEQVAAALKLTLVHKESQYNAALAKLDYIAVEQLVTSRALVNEYNEFSIQKAVDVLSKLNKAYPNTAEILGLMAYASHTQMRIGEFKSDTKFTIRLAEQALVLNNKNYDALVTLADTFASDPQTLHKAKGIYKDIIRFYPADPEGYTNFIDYLIRTNTPCQTIDAFIKSVPEGLLPAKQQQQLTFLISACLTPNIAADTLAKSHDKSISDLSFQFTNPDAQYLKFKNRIDKNPNQNNIGLYFWTLLKMGAYEDAQRIFEKIKLDEQSGGSTATILDSYNHDMHISKKPFDILDSLDTYGNNSTPLYLVLALTKQSIKDDKPDVLRNYLNKVSVFPVSIEALERSLGLIALQYNTGNLALSQKNAVTLFNQLTVYKKEFPASYRYWQLQNSYLALGFYSDNEQMAQTILADDFPADYVYWGWEGYKATKLFLQPWQDDPVVIEYLRRIKVDQARAREKFGVQ
jgi:TolB-like protein